MSALPSIAEVAAFNKTKTLKVQSNKGRHRIWLQGRDLDQAGFTARAAYTVSIDADIITLQLDQAAKRFVSGKDKEGGYREPVIDLCEKALAGFVRAATHVSVEFNALRGTITIRRVDPASSN